VPITDFAQYQALRRANASGFPIAKQLIPNGATIGSTWLQAPFAGVAPSTAAAVSDATAGALQTVKPLVQASGTLYFGGYSLGVARSATANTAFNQATCILIDRLSHQGGLVGNSGSVQTTNLPTAALTRYTGGDGVMIMVEVYTATGGTAVTLTAEYTNQAGTGTRNTPARSFIQNPEVGAAVILPLAPADIGVRSVESLTLSATTGTAGNIGVTLFKPLCWMTGANRDSLHNQVDALLNGGGQMPEIHPDACLGIVFLNSAMNNSPSPLVGSIDIIEV
jgi:hypothetical protein